MRACIVLAAISAGLCLPWLHGSAREALACSVGTVTLEQAVREADAAAVVYVETVRGPENNAPRLPPVATGLPPTSSRTRPVDLTGYGATLRVYSTVFGDLPSSFDVDTDVRQGMEQGLRVVESGFVPPCPVGYAVAHYVPGQYYVVLLQETPSGWATFYTFNYRVEGPDLLTTKVFSEERRAWAGPWEIEVRRPLYERFFSGTAQKVYPPADAPPGLAVTPEDEIWRLSEQRVSLPTFISALRYAHTQPSIRPPDTGDGGLLHSPAAGNVFQPFTS